MTCEDKKAAYDAAQTAFVSSVSDRSQAREYAAVAHAAAAEADAAQAEAESATVAAGDVLKAAQADYIDCVTAS